MSNVPDHYKNLVFEGGGVKGVAYGGVLEVLETSGIMPRIENVAGTSAGAITATLVSLRYTADDVIRIMMGLDFAKLEDGGVLGPAHLLEHYGWFKGDAFLKLMEHYIAQKAGDGRATFRDFKSQNFRNLRVFGTNLTRQSLAEFSYEQTPDVPVADAVRTSMSIPFFFEAVRRQDGDVYCDGGVLDNYPIETFDRQRIEPDPSRPGGKKLVRTPDTATLGFHLGTLKQKPMRIDHLTRLALSVFDALLDIQDILLKATPADVERTVFINTLGIQTTDFHITAEQKLQLIAQGRVATAKYLGRRPKPTALPEVVRLHERDDAAG